MIYSLCVQWEVENKKTYKNNNAVFKAKKLVCARVDMDLTQRKWAGHDHMAGLIDLYAGWDRTYNRILAYRIIVREIREKLRKKRLKRYIQSGILYLTLRP